MGAAPWKRQSEEPARETPEHLEPPSLPSRRLIDEILERAVPWGAFIALGALIGAAFPRETRAAAKRVMLAGMRASDYARAFGAEAYEKGQDVFAEVRLEYEQLTAEAEREAQRRNLRVVRSPRRRPTTRRGSRSRRREGQQASTS